MEKNIVKTGMRNYETEVESTMVQDGIAGDTNDIVEFHTEATNDVAQEMGKLLHETGEIREDFYDSQEGMILED